MINPLDVFFWTVRRNEKDVVNLYDALSPVMQLATGGSMLNFGLWDEKNPEPISAQNNLCSYFAKLAQLDSANKVIDVGSGLSAPALYWKENFPQLELFCININREQLLTSNSQNISLINSTSTVLPFSDKSVDRILALESAQHFKPLKNFVLEAKRILKPNGIFVMAIPVVMDSATISKLGILKFTWSSEHYLTDFVKKQVLENGFKIETEQFIGSKVYEPLANYYAQNREKLRQQILQKYPDYVESVLFKSIKKMKKASEQKIIDYMILKCVLDA